LSTAKTAAVSTTAMPHLHDDGHGLFIGVEANIGAGKTEFCHMLCRVRQQYDGNCQALLEPVGKPRFKKLLGDYYVDPKRWGFAFQMYALNERFRQHTLASELVASGTSVVQDRTIYADGCFGLAVLEDGNMTEDEWGIYTASFASLKRFLRYPDVMIYLRTDPAVCLERMKRRARTEECKVPLEYLQRIHQKHETYMSEMASYTRVLTVEWNQFGSDVEEINTRVNEIAGEARRFLRDFRRI